MNKTENKKQFKEVNNNNNDSMNNNYIIMIFIIIKINYNKLKI